MGEVEFGTCYYDDSLSMDYSHEVIMFHQFMHVFQELILLVSSRLSRAQSVSRLRKAKQDWNDPMRRFEEDQAGFVSRLKHVAGQCWAMLGSAGHRTWPSKDQSRRKTEMSTSPVAKPIRHLALHSL